MTTEQVVFNLLDRPKPLHHHSTKGLLGQGLVVLTAPMGLLSEGQHASHRFHQHLFCVLQDRVTQLLGSKNNLCTK